MDTVDTALIATPVGVVRVSGTADLIARIAVEPGLDAAGVDGESTAVREAVAQLRAYFAHRLDRFDLPLAPASTRRGEELRAALVAIPRGETRTYGALAALHASSARAIGGVCRTNPFPIVVPCHRVVSSAGVEHYSAGAGPATKAQLLAHERVLSI